MEPERASWWDRTVEFLNRDLWSPQETARRGVAWARTTLQLAVLVVQEAERSQLLLRSSSLTYYSALALIPLLAIALSVIKALGISENLAQRVVDQLAVGSPEAGERVLELVRQVDFGALGTLGAAVLFLTTVLGISSIEHSLNVIWGVQRERSWERRLPDYLAVLIVAPLLLGAAISLGTTLQSQALVQSLLEIPWFAAVYRVGLRQLPIAFFCLGFAFLYWFLPNTRVRIGPALIGGLIAAVLFSGAQRIYVGFSVGVSRYSVLFGSFAAIPLLLVWIYISWVITLLGAAIAFAVQNLPLARQMRQGEEPGPAARETVGLAISTYLARVFRDGGGAVESDAMADALEVPVRSVREILAALEAAGLVASRGDARDGFQLGRAADRIRVTDVLDALRGPRVGAVALTGVGPAVAELLSQMDQSAGKSLAGVTLADLIARLP
jgi:membrane protein